PSPTYRSTLSLHDALPISKVLRERSWTSREDCPHWLPRPSPRRITAPHRARLTARYDRSCDDRGSERVWSQRFCVESLQVRHFSDRKSTRLNSSHVSTSYA